MIRQIANKSKTLLNGKRYGTAIRAPAESAFKKKHVRKYKLFKTVLGELPRKIRDAIGPIMLDGQKAMIL